MNGTSVNACTRALNVGSNMCLKLIQITNVNSP
jgi:hypothetical protein